MNWRNQNNPCRLYVSRAVWQQLMAAPLRLVLRYKTLPSILPSVRNRLLRSLCRCAPDRFHHVSVSRVKNKGRRSGIVCFGGCANMICVDGRWSVIDMWCQRVWVIFIVVLLAVDLRVLDAGKNKHYNGKQGKIEFYS